MTLEFDNNEITNEQLADAANFYDELDYSTTFIATRSTIDSFGRFCEIG